MGNCINGDLELQKKNQRLFGRKKKGGFNEPSPIFVAQQSDSGHSKRSPVDHITASQQQMLMELAASRRVRMWLDERWPASIPVAEDRSSFASDIPSSLTNEFLALNLRVLEHLEGPVFEALSEGSLPRTDLGRSDDRVGEIRGDSADNIAGNIAIPIVV